MLRSVKAWWATNIWGGGPDLGCEFDIGSLVRHTEKNVRQLYWMTSFCDVFKVVWVRRVRRHCYSPLFIHGPQSMNRLEGSRLHLQRCFLYRCVLNTCTGGCSILWLTCPTLPARWRPYWQEHRRRPGAQSRSHGNRSHSQGPACTAHTACRTDRAHTTFSVVP